MTGGCRDNLAQMTADVVVTQQGERSGGPVPVTRGAVGVNDGCDIAIESLCGAGDGE